MQNYAADMTHKHTDNMHIIVRMATIIPDRLAYYFSALLHVFQFSY